MNQLQIALLALGAATLASASFPVHSHAEEQIACASEVPAVRKGQGHWYYRIVDGRKCWYDGKPMLPKTQLYWPGSSNAETKPAPAASSKEPAKASRPDATPYTDGRSVSAPAAVAQPAVTPSATTESTEFQPATVQSPAWPAPAANEISFESRWLGLHSRN